MVFFVLCVLSLTKSGFVGSPCKRARLSLAACVRVMITFAFLQ